MSTPSERPALPIYLGPTLSRWQPRTVVDVQTAIDDGTLKERHWLDVKAEVGTTDSTKKGLAKDLAAFANDGGGVIVGVREDKAASTLTIEPVLLEGLTEAVDQIARSRCDPPLYVVCHPLLAPRQPDGRARGILLIEVPPSTSAPHMADGRYYGRSDTTNYQLTDGDVARLHGVRTARQVTAGQVMDREFGRDPIAADVRQLSHFHVVAQPIGSPPDLLTSLIGSYDLNVLVRQVPEHVPYANSAAPSWGSFYTYGEPRAEGTGFRSYGMPGRHFIADLEGAKERDLLDVEIEDSGRTTLFCGRGSDVAQDDHYVIDTTIGTLTRCLVTLAGQLGETAGFAGRWVLVVGVDELSGKVTSSARNQLVARRGLVLLGGGVEVPEFDAGVFGGELPVHLTLVGVGVVLPGGELGVEDLEVADAAVQALAGQR